MRTRLIVFLTCLAVLAPASLAEAKPPPKGTYACTIGGTTLFGTFYVVGKTKYRYDAYDGKGKPGKFSTKGKKIKLRSGPLKGSKGNWFIGTRKERAFSLSNPRSGFTSIECIREKTST